MKKVLLAFFVAGLITGVFLVYPLHINQSTPGNYTLLVDSNYLPYAEHLISSANRSILLVVYSAKYYPNYPNPLLDSLCNASKRGVDVKVILDDELDYNKDTIDYLKKCGVSAMLDSRNTRTHAKFLVVDSKYVIIGSTNWSYSSLNKNHEVDVLVDDPNLAKRLEAYAAELV